MKKKMEYLIPIKNERKIRRTSNLSSKVTLSATNYRDNYQQNHVIKPSSSSSKPPKSSSVSQLYGSSTNGESVDCEERLSQNNNRESDVKFSRGPESSEVLTSEDLRWLGRNYSETKFKKPNSVTQIQHIKSDCQSRADGHELLLKDSSKSESKNCDNFRSNTLALLKEYEHYESFIAEELAKLHITTIEDDLTSYSSQVDIASGLFIIPERRTAHSRPIILDDNARDISSNEGLVTFLDEIWLESLVKAELELV